MMTFIRTFSLISLIVLGGSLATYTADKKEDFKLASENVSFPPLYLTRPDIVTLATLGHRDFYNSVWMIWITQLINPLSPVLSADDFLKLSQSILIQQPQSERFYIAFCYYAIEHYHRPDFCENFSQVGLKLFPQSWVIPLSQGYVYGFVVKDLGRASAFYALAASRPNAPQYAHLLAEKLKRNDNVSDSDYNVTIEILRRFTGNQNLGDQGKRAQP